VFTAIINKNMDATNKNVLRKLLPNAAGIRLTTLNAGASQIIPISYDLSGIDILEYPNLAVIVFVQKINGDKDVLQSAFLDGFTINGQIVLDVEFPLNGAAKAYPNPVDRTLTIELKENVKEDVDLTLADSFGRIHLLGKINKGENKTETNVEHLAPGLYVLQFKSQNQQFTQKLIIER
jgi:hypothetical protein